MIDGARRGTVEKLARFLPRLIWGSLVLLLKKTGMVEGKVSETSGVLAWWSCME